MAYRFILAERACHSVRMMCRVLRVSRSAFYAWQAAPKRRARRDLPLTVRIRAIHAARRGTYGAPRIAAALRREGLNVNRKRVSRLMRQEGLQGRPRRRFRGCTTDSAHCSPVAPERLGRNFAADKPDAVWVGDITYIPAGPKWSYLAVLIDLYSRKVVGWAVAGNMCAGLVSRALQRALAVRRPAPGLVHHSDRGSQYASDAYVSQLREAGIVQSMSRKGNCWDNAVAESFSAPWSRS